MRTLETLKRFKPSRAQLIGGALILSSGMLAYAVPNVFTAGTTVSAAQMNANFTDVEARIAALEAKLANMTVATVNGQPTVRFSGVNVQVINGAGSTETTNGTGNLIVGYNEADSSGNGRCTVGIDPATGAAVTDAAVCAAAGGAWSTTGFKTGSHYIVAGSENNYSIFGGVVFGFRNTSNNSYANVTGGSSNTAGGNQSSVSGGNTNAAYSSSTSISGGSANIASGDASSVSGGNRNNASGSFSSVSGGSWGIASGRLSHVSGGGDGNTSGGNVADMNFSSILGGVGQNTSVTAQTIPALP